MNIIIHEVKHADAEFLSHLLNIPEIQRRLHMLETTQRDWKDAIQFWEEDQDEKDYIVWNCHTPIGWFGVNGLESPDKKAYLKMAVLLPQYQGGGIGHLVIERLTGDLKAEGYAAVGLFTDLDNVQAQKCYAKCGFLPVRILEEEMSNGEMIKRLEMEKTL